VSEAAAAAIDPGKLTLPFWLALPTALNDFCQPVWQTAVQRVRQAVKCNAWWLSLWAVLKARLSYSQVKSTRQAGGQAGTP
jgi:hypothetical protein